MTEAVIEPSQTPLQLALIRLDEVIVGPPLLVIVIVNEAEHPVASLTFTV